MDDKVFYGAFCLTLGDEQIHESFREMYRHDHRTIVHLTRAVETTKRALWQALEGA